MSARFILRHRETRILQSCNKDTAEFYEIGPTLLLIWSGEITDVCGGYFLCLHSHVLEILLSPLIIKTEI